MILDEMILDNLFTQRTKFTELANICKNNIDNYTNVLLQSMAEEYAFQILKESYKTSGQTYMQKEKILEALKMKDRRFTQEDMQGGLKRLKDTGKAIFHFEDGRMEGIELKVEKK